MRFLLTEHRHSQRVSKSGLRCMHAAADSSWVPPAAKVCVWKGRSLARGARARKSTEKKVLLRNSKIKKLLKVKNKWKKETDWVQVKFSSTPIRKKGLQCRLTEFKMCLELEWGQKHMGGIFINKLRRVRLYIYFFCSSSALLQEKWTDERQNRRLWVLVSPEVLQNNLFIHSSSIVIVMKWYDNKYPLYIKIGEIRWKMGWKRRISGTFVQRFSLKSYKISDLVVWVLNGFAISSVEKNVEESDVIWREVVERDQVVRERRVALEEESCWRFLGHFTHLLLRELDPFSTCSGLMERVCRGESVEAVLFQLVPGVFWVDSGIRETSETLGN